MNQKEIDKLIAENKELKAQLIEKSAVKEKEEWLDSADIIQKFHFSESKLYRLRRANKIPFTPIGNRYYYPKNYFDNLLLLKLKGGI